MLQLLTLSALFLTTATSYSFRELENPPEWDISVDGPLYLHLKADTYTIPSRESGKDAATWLTRVICYGNTSDISQIPDSQCGIPGPTIVLHANDEVQSVYLVNNLEGIGSTGHESNAFESYKDPDVINLHVHGLNVYPEVDDVVDFWVNPICNDDVAGGVEGTTCFDTAQSHHYNYTIHKTHYPGTHWYHGHWHGSTALHVNGGFYGVIKVVANEEITDLDCYEPQLSSDENDHIIAASFVWLNTNENCSEILNNAKNDCRGNHGNFGTTQLYPDYVYSAGVPPFKFAIQGWCWIQCKYLGDVPSQQNASQVQYDVTFDPNGPWKDEDIVKTFLINGVAQPTLVMKTYEWHRLRILNTNMAYLIWQLNAYGDIDSDYKNAIQDDACLQYLISLDGVYLSDGPRLVTDPPYNGSIVIPPGGRANIMLYCFEPGNYSVIASDNTRNTLFSNAPVPDFTAIVMDLYVEDQDNVTLIEDFACQNITTCQIAGSTGSPFPCEFVPYLPWSPYLAPTEDLIYPDVTAKCQTVNNNAKSQMNQCNIVLQHKVPGLGGSLPNQIAQVSVNHIGFSSTEPLLNLATNVTHEWLITSNFHEFHQHIWPYQLQTDVVEGWLAQTGEWRDVVGAPGSYIARSNFFGVNIDGNHSYDGYFRGKLVHHCHFVPHEDHGLMAYHELEDPSISYDNDPIVPVQVEANYSTDKEPPASDKWVTDCTQFSGISSVIIQDSKTILIWYFKQFKYNGYCFFGYLPIVTFRPGHVSNAFIGLGLWGSYQNGYTNVVMDGRALAFTLQATDSGDLDEIYVAEVDLNTTIHDFKPQTTTPTVCQNSSFAGTFDETGRQFRFFYCVRPRTKDDYPSDDFDPSKHFYEEGKDSSEAFGYAYAYGEGQFFYRTMHASRGTCGMFFVDESSNAQNTGETLETSLDYLEQEAFECIQEGIIVGETSGQKVIVNRTHFNIDSVFVDAEAFITLSGYDVSNIPSDDDDTDGVSGLGVNVWMCCWLVVCLVLFGLGLW